jgi:hypothetical protein
MIYHLAFSGAEKSTRRFPTSSRGVTGTRWLVDSEVYPKRLAARGLAHIRPTAAERDEIEMYAAPIMAAGFFPASLRCAKGPAETGGALPFVEHSTLGQSTGRQARWAHLTARSRS